MKCAIEGCDREAKCHVQLDPFGKGIRTCNVCFAKLVSGGMTVETKYTLVKLKPDKEGVW